jgi:hypothetical protein
MGLTSAGIQRLAATVDALLRDCYPCILTIGSTSVTAAGPGAAETSRLEDGGEDWLASEFRFRLPAGSPAVAVGDPITWTVGPRDIPLEVTAVEIRPADPSVPIRARIRRV